MNAPEYPVKDFRLERLRWCRSAIRGIERFTYTELMDAKEGSPQANEAQGLLRQVIGLRRKLDNWRED